ncbi:MAG: hypothetical protein JW893_07910 [Candidatus Omnitrophica bacterium]|nr:hypothetical protein [Candidatus Omnitrophota bacterium]
MKSTETDHVQEESATKLTVATMQKPLRTVKKNLLDALMSFHGHELATLGAMLDPPVTKSYLCAFFKMLALKSGTNNPRVIEQICRIYSIDPSILFPVYDPTSMTLPVREDNPRNFLGMKGAANG